MGKKTDIYKKGFTLVELAIVLVIIGLLVGGILTAQSMIQTAKVARVVSELTQYDTAVVNFKSTYQELPGDSTKFAPAGNGDGYLNYDATYGLQNGHCYVTEMANFWRHLSDAGMLDKKYTDVAPNNGLQAGYNMASISYNKNVGLTAGTQWDYCAYWGCSPGLSAIGPRQNFYLLRGNFIPASGSCPSYSTSGYSLDNNDNKSASPVPPEFALAVDTKIDDGKPNSGKVAGARAKEAIFLRITPSWNAALPERPSICVTEAGDNYAIGVANSGCSLAIKMESLAGDAGNFAY